MIVTFSNELGIGRDVFWSSRAATIVGSISPDTVVVNDWGTSLIIINAPEIPSQDVVGDGWRGGVVAVDATATPFSTIL